MSITRSVFVLACTTTLTLLACQAPTDDAPEIGPSGFPSRAYASLSTEPTRLGVELRTAPSQPPSRGTVRAELRVLDASGAARDGLELKITPWMPSHGHGTAVTPKVTPLGNGAYLVESLWLSMAGTWELHIEMTDEGGFVDHAIASMDVH